MSFRTDFGVTFMGLNTDSQYMAYVLKDDETEPPVGLQKGLTEHSNVMQDILMKEIVPGRSGNEVLQSTLVEMKKLGINGTVCKFSFVLFSEYRLLLTFYRPIRLPPDW
jgi:hypothetical protein